MWNKLFKLENKMTLSLCHLAHTKFIQKTQFLLKFIPIKIYKFTVYMEMIDIFLLNCIFIKYLFYPKMIIK